MVKVFGISLLELYQGGVEKALEQHLDYHVGR